MEYSTTNQINSASQANDDILRIVIAGVLIGTATGWDDVDSLIQQFYDFRPIDRWKSILQDCNTFIVDYESGLLSMCGDGDEFDVKEVQFMSLIDHMMSQ